MLCCIFIIIIIIIFPSFRAPALVPCWHYIGYNSITRFHCSHCCTLCLCTCFYLRCVTNKIGLDWIGCYVVSHIVILNIEIFLKVSCCFHTVLLMR